MGIQLIIFVHELSPSHHNPARNAHPKIGTERPGVLKRGLQTALRHTMCIVLLWILVQLALATPAASPVTAVAMTQELADASEMSKTALKILPIMLVIEMVIAIPISQIFFPM